MFCPSCGTENADTAVFCAKCGTKIDSAAPNPQPPPLPKTPAPPRTTVDTIPNAAEGIVRPVVLGALALLAFQFAAYAFGGPNRTTLGNLFGLLVMTADLILFTALWSGLRRIGSPAAKPASHYAVALAMIVPATALQIGLALIAASAGDKAEAAAGAILLPGLVSAIAGLAAFVSFILFVVAVRKAHDGKLRTFSTVFLVYTIVSMVVAPVLVFAPGAGGCAAVVLHGWLLLSLAKILSAPAPEGEEGFVFKKTPKKLYLCWGFVLALCIGGIALLPADIPAVGGGNPLSGLFGAGVSESTVKSMAKDLSKQLVANANGKFKSFGNFKKVGPDEWTATVKYETFGGFDREDTVRIRNNNGYVTVAANNESAPSGNSSTFDPGNSSSSFSQGINRGINKTIAINNGREIVQAVLSANIERTMNMKNELWPRYGKGMTNAKDYFDPLFEKGYLKGVNPDLAKGWSVFVREETGGWDDIPFLVSSNVTEANKAGPSAISIVPGYLSVNPSDATFGREVVVITRRGLVLKGQQANMSLISGTVGPWELLHAE